MTSRTPGTAPLYQVGKRTWTGPSLKDLQRHL